MPLNIDLNLPTKEPPLALNTLNNFKKGVITLIDQSRLPKDALKEAKNIFLYEDGQPGPRPGVDYYGAVSPNGEPWDGFDYFETSAGATHLVGVAGGTVYRSTDDATTWTACTGATLTADVACYFEQNGGYLYITNGTDNITRYDGTTTLATYTSISTPSAPTVAETGLTGTANSFWYKISAVNSIGFSAASAASTQVQADLERSSWDASNKVTLTLPALTGTILRWDIYLSTDNTNFFYLSSSSTTTFIDDGTYFVSPSITAPTENTTQGPLVQELVNVGSRMYGIRDSDNEYRIWFTGSGPYAGYFSSAYDGGYLDWQEGGKYKPVQVADYRDGKGTPYATIWCKSADGQGCVLQMSLDVLTIGDISITVPAAYKLPGSRGTGAPGSVVNVLNDYMFYNSQAFYNIGTRAQFQNLLSTDESSSNIRPDVKKISASAESGIASEYFDARVYFSVPIASTTNNTTMIYDTERRAWLPEAFDIGFSRFLKYTDTSGNRKLLALRPGDTKLSEISSDIQGDYGSAFTTSLLTGLYPTVEKNRFDFMWVREGEVELNRPTGTIEIRLLGIDRKNGYSVIRTLSSQNDPVDAGWSSFSWSSTEWTDTTDVPSLYAQSSEKYYFRVQKDLNAYQWNIVTSSTEASYILRTLQVNGTQTLAGKPRLWRINV